MENACVQIQKWITETSIIKIFKVPNLDPKPELTDRENNTAKKTNYHASDFFGERILGLAMDQGLGKPR